MYEHKDRQNGLIQIYSSSTFDGLVKAVTDGRRKSGKLHVNYNKVYNELKRAQVPTKTKDVKNKRPHLRDYSAKDIMNGAKSIVNTSLLGDTVSQQEILRRGQICKTCPRNQVLDGCTGCGWGKKASELFAASRSLFKGKAYEIPTELKKSNCAVCGCYLSNMLPAKPEAFLKDTPDKAALRPAECWLTPFVN